MEIFLDNDIILKLSSARLLKEIEKIFNVQASGIYVLPSCYHYISKSKRVKEKYSRETIDYALSVIKDYKQIPDEYINQEYFVKLNEINGIDSGEQLLFSLNPASSEYLILTGDKVALKALSETDCNDIKNNISGKIVCLEYIFLRLIENVNFWYILSQVQDSKYCGDRVIEIVFEQENLTVEKAKEGLTNYYDDLKDKSDKLLL